MLCQVWPHQESCTKLQQFSLSPETLHVTTLLVLQVTVLRCSFIVTALILLSYWSQSFVDKYATLVIHVQTTLANGSNTSALWDAGKRYGLNMYRLTENIDHFSNGLVLNLLNWFIRWFINSLITWWVSCHMQGVHIIKSTYVLVPGGVASNITFSWSTSSTATEIMMIP